MARIRSHSTPRRRSSGASPPSADAPREPDRWTFALEGPAHVTLDISEGMGAEILKLGDAPASIAKIAYKRGFDGVLRPGRI